jgi:hypothetical protein
MVVYNYSGKEINAKIVYYGPALSGKTTNLEWIYSKIPVEYSGKMVSLRTQADRTIFFDFLPLDLGMIDGFRTRFMLYTVPGQVHYNATRKMVLKGVDGLVFVADSEPGRMQDNIESLQNLRDNLQELGMNPDSLPLVMQWNKRDLPNCMSVADLETRLNPRGLPSFEACALTGEGVYETLHKGSRLIYTKLTGAQMGNGEDENVSLFGDSIALCLQDVDKPQPEPEAVAIGADTNTVRASAPSDPLGAILGRDPGSASPSAPIPTPAEPSEREGSVDDPSQPFRDVIADPVPDPEPDAHAGPDPVADPSFESPGPDDPAAPSARAEPLDDDQLGGLVDQVLSSLDERDDLATIDATSSRSVVSGPDQQAGSAIESGETPAAASGAPAEASGPPAEDRRPLAERLDRFFEGIGNSGAVPPVTADEPSDDGEGLSVEHDVDVFAELNTAEEDPVCAAEETSSEVAEEPPASDPGPQDDPDEAAPTGETDDEFQLITDPRRLPTSGSTPVSGSVATLGRSGVLEIPVTIDAEMLDDDTPLRIVLNVQVRR